jgi:hypothetical protein
MSTKVDGEIVDNISFDSLNVNSAFIKRQKALKLKDGTEMQFANPEYFEFKNSVNGRKSLAETDIDKNFKNAVMCVWGDNPTVEDLE